MPRDDRAKARVSYAQREFKHFASTADLTDAYEVRLLRKLKEDWSRAVADFQ